MRETSKNCKYWKQQVAQDSHFCARLLSDRSTVAYADGYGTVSWLITTADFGCNQFEEKE